MNKRLKPWKLTIIHAAAWILYTLWATKILAFKPNVNYHFGSILLTYLLFAAEFYFLTLWLFPKFLNRRKLPVFLILILVSLMVFIGADYWIEYVFEVSRYGVMPPKLNLWEFAIAVTWHFLKYFGFAIAFHYPKWYIKRGKQVVLAQQEKLEADLAKEKAERELEQQSYFKGLIELEKERLAYENAYLRAQINPHFVHNTLTALQGYLRGISAEAAKCMNDFSDVMRYSFENSNDGLVSFEDELDCIKKIIAIHQFRFQSRLNIVYEEEGQLGGRIVPHILITLAENAMKYGDLANPNHPVRIRVEQTADDRMIFSVWNKKLAHPNEEMERYGIGLQNLHKRLQTMYRDNHNFIIKESEADYFVQITLEL